MNHVEVKMKWIFHYTAPKPGTTVQENEDMEKMLEFERTTSMTEDTQKNTMASLKHSETRIRLLSPAFS